MLSYTKDNIRSVVPSEECNITSQGRLQLKQESWFCSVVLLATFKIWVTWKSCVRDLCRFASDLLDPRAVLGQNKAFFISDISDISHSFPCAFFQLSFPKFSRNIRSATCRHTIASDLPIWEWYSGSLVLWWDFEHQRPPSGTSCKIIYSSTCQICSGCERER